VDGAYAKTPRLQHVRRCRPITLSSAQLVMPVVVISTTAECRLSCTLACVQVQQVAQRKHGSLQAVEEVKHQKVQHKLEERVRKRRREAEQATREKEQLERLQAAQERMQEDLLSQHQPKQQRFGACWVCGALGLC
jgi:low affinity Fe/Cu permease